ncbi:MAG: inorganic pyrophosphatase [Bacteroidetes bacterium]|nr:inorganic pyrophosphatase [Bacteroidota bacterium]
MECKCKSYKAHPWHGIDPGKSPPEEINVFVEIVPTDTVKYEIDKTSGYLTIDRPQKFSNVVPTLYGFIPRTYCGPLIAEYDTLKSGKTTIKGDGDPLDVCVLCERTIAHGDILLHAVPIGGLRMTDKGESDDKIIAVLKGDEVYASWVDIEHVPEAMINRLKHYFLTYKNIPGKEIRPSVELVSVFGKKEALNVINKCIKDYQVKFVDAISIPIK